MPLDQILTICQWTDLMIVGLWRWLHLDSKFEAFLIHCMIPQQSVALHRNATESVPILHIELHGQKLTYHVHIRLRVQVQTGSRE
jgi:hypothetical protein